MFEPVWRRLVGHPCASMRGELHGFRRVRVAGQTYPGIIADPEATTPGRIYFGLDAEDLQRLDRFEGEHYRRTPVTVWISTRSGDRVSIEVEAYVFDDAAALSGDPWIPEEFGRDCAAEFFEQHSAGAMPPERKPLRSGSMAPLASV